VTPDAFRSFADSLPEGMLLLSGDGTILAANVRLAEAPSFGKAALFHDKDSRGALAYLALAGEMIRREEEPISGPIAAEFENDEAAEG